MVKKLLILLITFPLILLAQKQPKVGLVLSGGGAKGFAHIGVLKELEKAGVQIDYIGGTSMGAIVGGLYASGYKPNQIEQIIKDINFQLLLQDKIPRRDKSYFEKVHAEKHAISLPLKKGSIGLPMGLSKGQNVLNLFTELLARVDHIDNFSKLPIPFYCIGTDIETGEEIVLDKGSLPLAIRASGSFPSLLNPVDVNGRLLIDGGVVNNFPVDRMKEKGVDIIIGVDVQGKLIKQEELSSITSILQQIINFQMYKKSDEQVKMVDIYMHPDVSNYTVISFDDAPKIIEEGVKVAKPFKTTFDSIAKLQTVRKKIPEIQLTSEKILVDRIVINGNKNYTKNYILGKLKLKEKDSTSYKDISTKISTLAATKNFKRIDYSFNESYSGKKLTLKVKEDSIKSYLKLGLHYDLLYRSGVLLNYNHKKLLTKNDELSVNLVIGDKVRYDLQYFIDNGYLLSYGLSFNHHSFSTDILFNNDIINKINISYNSFNNRIYGQTTLDKKFAFVFGLDHKNIKITSETFLTNNKKTFFDESNYINAFAFIHMDTFNKEQFPTDGFYADVNFTWYLWSDRNENLRFFSRKTAPFVQFSQLNGEISFANSFWNDFTLQGTVEVGLTLGNIENTLFDYRLGGYNKNYVNSFRRMYGYEISELTEQSFLRTEFDFRYNFFKKHHLSFIANYASVKNNVFKNFDFFEELKSGYAVGYGLETLIGPVELKYSWSPDHSKKFWYFNLGFWF